MVSSVINNKFDEWKLRDVKIIRVLWTSYHKPNLLLIALETMGLLVNHQLVPIAIQPKSISLEQICYKISQGIAVTSPHSLLFQHKKTKT